MNIVDSEKEPSFEDELIYHALEEYVHQFDAEWINNNEMACLKMIMVLNKYRAKVGA